jgi:hypothetical protein
MGNLFTLMREFARRRFFDLLQRAVAADDGKQALAHALKGLVNGFAGNLPSSALRQLPYADLAGPLRRGATGVYDHVVFITGRFRSGSTLLWNLFRHLPGCTAYYEPFNERRWFDPSMRGDRVDATHRHVSDYWREYAGLECLAEYYSEEWTRRNLYMEGTFWEPRMKRFVEILIRQAAGRPVLQFNRIDFRLPWFRAHFPGATIVHLYRHPRDQWCSTLMDEKCYANTKEIPSCFQEHDRFYLQQWATDLKYHFPFLAPDQLEHPYQMFYYLWKLSYVFGSRDADHSVKFEELVEHPRRILGELFTDLDIPCHNWQELLALVAAPELGRWRRYAAAAWFERHEAKCEEVLREFFTAVEDGKGPPSIPRLPCRVELDAAQM